MEHLKEEKLEIEKLVKSSISSYIYGKVLEDIDGVGKGIREKLIEEFHDLPTIRTKSYKEIYAVVGHKTATENIRKTIDSNGLKIPKSKTRHPLAILLPEEARISSFMTGLMTSMGEKFWEELVKLLAKKNGFEIQDFFSDIPDVTDNSKLHNKIAALKTKKENKRELTHQKIFREIKDCIDKEKPTYKKKLIKGGKNGDVWLCKEGINYLMDIKTVQTNKGNGLKYSGTLIDWYSYCALMGMEKVECFIAFPYNPYWDGDYWDEEAQKVSPLIPGEEAKVADELWDFISGKKGIEKLIFEVFQDLKTKKFDQIIKDVL